MNTLHNPMRTTIVYGLLCGLMFVPITSGLRLFFHWPLAFSLAIWLYIAGYSLLLARWGGKGPATVVFPLLLLFGFLFLSRSTAAFFFLALGILSWIRSGICFEKPFFKTFFAELLVGAGGGILVAGFAPHSAIALALGIWLFFLIQSVYFVLFRDVGATEKKLAPDPFEQARKQAETILSTGKGQL